MIWFWNHPDMTVNIMMILVRYVSNKAFSGRFWNVIFALVTLCIWLIVQVVVDERLRCWTRNPLGSPCAGSNPADYILIKRNRAYIQKVLFEKKKEFIYSLRRNPLGSCRADSNPTDHTLDKKNIEGARWNRNEGIPLQSLWLIQRTQQSSVKVPWFHWPDRGILIACCCKTHGLLYLFESKINPLAIDENLLAPIISIQQLRTCTVFSWRLLRVDLLCHS